MVILAKLLVLLASVSTVPASPTRPDDKARAELQSILNARAAAFKQKQLEEYMKAVAPEFKQKLLDGRVLTRAQTLDTLKEFFRDHRSISSCVFKIKEGTVKGKQATILVEQQLSYPSVTQDSGSNEFIQGMSASRQVWVKGGDGWKLKNVEVLRSDFTSSGSKKGGSR